ncbi:ABC transporter ATP-binding protein [Rathayibacter sp. VKM Ac-2760]|uniref:ABC transporter ATP-binding protein n=1 Tax=Rathayibacter sp. VKM Ac-2760 TaxID=2609253 RepID=UPI0013194056|nr:ABC transporter ATP-binding protein [Rathayibacter sp. VKM Ac-2760]QHC58716.1 ATP-binding cassette domain-containing protein [Rathayibacter sp. VKM Ac-2760]
MPTNPALAAESLTVRFGRSPRPALDSVDVALEPGTMTAVVGPNGSGKSTLLRSLGRLESPTSGAVLVDGSPIGSVHPRALAREVGILPQAPATPEGMSVLDLVARGRDPHRRWYDQWSTADEEVVLAALDRTGLPELADAHLDELSGGQRQRAWIAMALAQEPRTLLLDEPTTYLDIAHQLDVLDLLARINHEQGTTMALVLHDLSLAARCCDRLLVLSDGTVVADGPPAEVLTVDLLREVFEIEAQILADATTGRPVVLPIRRTEG